MTTVVSEAAKNKAASLLVEQINPEVKHFKEEVASQLEGLRSLTSEIETLKGKSNENADNIAEILSSVRKSQKEIDEVKTGLFGLSSDLTKLERGLVEIQYYTYKGRNIFPNPYHERIMQKLNELLIIAVPDPAERAQVIKEIENYSPKK